MSKELTEKWQTITTDLGNTIHYCGKIQNPQIKQYVFHFNDGEKAVYKADKDCKSLQDFLDRMNKVHDIEKENKKLKEQLKEANNVIKKYAESDNWFEEDMHGEVWSFQKENKYPWRMGFRYLKKWGVK